MHNLTGLQFVNVELTSMCNKSCFMCGRRKLEKDYPHLAKWGNMPASMAIKIAHQLPEGIVVAFHNNGDPLMYPDLKQVLPHYKKQIRVLDTNGKMLVQQADAIINNLDTITISVIENDLEGDEQFEIVKKFIGIKQNKKPRMIYRLLGDVKDAERWYKLPGMVATRILHSPDGSFDYRQKTTVPEIGICLEALTHLAIDRFGDVSMCVRFDPKREGVIGNILKNSLEDLWNSKKRKDWIQKHVLGKRSEISLCSKCEFWGIPKGF